MRNPRAIIKLIQPDCSCRLTSYNIESGVEEMLPLPPAGKNDYPTLDASFQDKIVFLEAGISIHFP